MSTKKRSKKKKRGLKKSIKKKLESSKPRTKNTTEIPSGETPPAPPPQGFLGQLYANEGKKLRELLELMPFFSGTWIAAGLTIDYPLPMVIATLSLFAARALDNLRSQPQQDIPYQEYLHMLLYFAQILGVFFFYSTVQHLPLSLILAFVLTCLTLRGQLDSTKPTSALIDMGITVVSMGALALLGIGSQQLPNSIVLYPQFALIGIIPGTLVASSALARRSNLFTSHGWRRRKPQNNRPGRLMQLFALLSILGPATATLLPPFGLLPVSFMICALGFYKVPDLLESFHNESQEDYLIGLKVLNIAALQSILVLVAGITA